MPHGSEQSFRHQSSGSLNIPTGNMSVALGMPDGNMQTARGGAVVVGGQAFDGPRSPPGKQNTSHVPCKFFRQGACQAGKACPFSHDLASVTDNVCKYFAKGNCKFGPKCANIHVLPNGQRIAYHKGAPIMGIPATGAGGMPGLTNAGMQPLNLGGRVHPDPYHNQPSALTNSLYRANMGYDNSAAAAAYPQYGGGPEDFSRGSLGAMDINHGVPSIETTNYASDRGSAYGSPRDDSEMYNGASRDRFGLGLSPIPAKGLSVLDAPLPASFDSNGVSWIARHGPVASSVPSKFGMMQESPASSVGFGGGKETGSSALKNLYSSVYGEDNNVGSYGAGEEQSTDGFVDEYGSRGVGSGRMLHSQRFARTKVMSSSLPKGGAGLKGIDRDWDNDFTFEEDYLPDNLKELLTPMEKARRGSRNNRDDDESGLGNGRPIYNGNGSYNGAVDKFGSPSNASPSRWGPLFQRQQREEEERQASSLSRASAFGHVGSPLRSSMMAGGSSTIPRSGGELSGSPYASSPARSGLGMSMISQQLGRMKIERNGSDASGGLSSLRNASAPIGTPPSGGFGGSSGLGVRREPERAVSGNSLSGIGGRKFSQIEEEDSGEGDDLFRMEEEEDKNVRTSGGAIGNGTLSGGGWQFGGAGSKSSSSSKGPGGIGMMFGDTK